MKFLKKAWIRKAAIMALSVSFIHGTLSTNYPVCDDVSAQSASAGHAISMTDMDCASMQKRPASASEKSCCSDYSCPKCFTSPLTTSRQIIHYPAHQQATLQATVTLIEISHHGFGIDRPPKMI